jgi:hypothetical protein
MARSHHDWFLVRLFYGRFLSRNRVFADRHSLASILRRSPIRSYRSSTLETAPRVTGKTCWPNWKRAKEAKWPTTKRMAADLARAGEKKARRGRCRRGRCQWLGKCEPGRALPLKSADGSLISVCLRVCVCVLCVSTAVGRWHRFCNCLTGTCIPTTTHPYP